MTCPLPSLRYEWATCWRCGQGAVCELWADWFVCLPCGEVMTDEMVSMLPSESDFELETEEEAEKDISND